MRSSKVIRAQSEDGLRVLGFEPKKFPVAVPEQAKVFLGSQPEEGLSTSFRINDTVAEQTGLQEIERQNLEKKIEQMAIEKLKTIQEEAYKQAYDLGLDEGRTKAFNDTKAEIDSQIETLGKVLATIESLKKTLVATNEAQIVDLVFFLAKKLALTDIDANPERVLPVLRQVLEAIQTDEEITVKLNPEDMEKVEKLQKASERKFDYLKKVKLQEAPEVRIGGCVLETNYGMVDASVEERVEKLWTLLNESKPLLKDVIGA